MSANQKFNMTKSIIVFCFLIGIYVSNCQISVGQNFNRRPFLWSPPPRTSSTSPSTAGPAAFSLSSLPSASSNIYGSRPRPTFNLLQPLRPLFPSLYQPSYQPLSQPQPQPRPPISTSINNNRIPLAPPSSTNYHTNNNNNNVIVRRPIVTQPSASPAQRRPSPAQTWRWALGRRAQWRPRTTLAPERSAPQVLSAATNSTTPAASASHSAPLINEQPVLPSTNVTLTPVSQPTPNVESVSISYAAAPPAQPSTTATDAVAAAANGEF